MESFRQRNARARWTRVIGYLGLAACGALTPLQSAAADTLAHPRLILQITVDALRGDLLDRYAHVLGEGGFRMLVDEGVVFTNAHYAHANTETIVGHASLATGTVPAVHGMVGNVWFDRQAGRLLYNIEDAKYRLLSADADVDQSTEIDPTQKAAKSDGRSPENILSSTFSDELAVRFSGRSKIFGVSVKDRGAVSMAGHAGKAFWFSKKTGDFVTSNYYYDQYPAWVSEWNAKKAVAAYADTAWTLSKPAGDYIFGDADDQDYETDVAGFGVTFPHAYGPADDKYFTTKLTLSPAGDELTLDFALALLDAEQLGMDDVPDYLAVSFSSTDYVGHAFGASSLETEDNLLRLDRVLARLFAAVDKKIGLANTLIVLSADHGQPEVPGHLHKLGIGSAAYFDADNLIGPAMDATLKDRFGIGNALIQNYFHPYIYLNEALIALDGLDAEEVSGAIIEVLERQPGVAYAFSSAALMKNRLAPAPTATARMVVNNFNSRRSGDIYVVFAPNIYINDFDGLRVSSAHGSPWRYDTFVPVIFAGHGIQAARIHREVTPYDVAPTLAAYVGAKPPSGAVGAVLDEVLKD